MLVFECCEVAVGKPFKRSLKSTIADTWKGVALVGGLVFSLLLLHSRRSYLVSGCFQVSALLTAAMLRSVISTQRAGPCLLVTFSFLLHY